MGDLALALHEVERASKKQRTSTESTVQCIDELIEKLTTARHKMQSPALEPDAGQALLEDIMKGLNLHTKIACHQKEIHSSVSKLGKVGASVD
eukprot:scaffold176096_cov56-Prasinocladus_malaysianus.AAC.1